MTPDELYTQAKESPVLSREVTDTLLESLEYSSISFLNQAVEILGIFRARLERGDRIILETSGDVLNLRSFRKFVENTFSDYIYGHVIRRGQRAEEKLFPSDAVRAVTPLFWLRMANKTFLSGFLHPTRGFHLSI